MVVVAEAWLLSTEAAAVTETRRRFTNFIYKLLIRKRVLLLPVLRMLVLVELLVFMLFVVLLLCMIFVSLVLLKQRGARKHMVSRTG